MACEICSFTRRHLFAVSDFRYLLFSASSGHIETRNVRTEPDRWLLVHHLQDDWLPWLSFDAFAGNNGKSESTMCTPLIAVQHTDPDRSFVAELTNKCSQCLLDAD